jgi:hypothetical protein
MSGVAIVRLKLVAYSALTAVVPEAKIRAGVIPLGEQANAISLTQISGSPRNTLSMQNAKVLHTDRVRVLVQAGSYPVKEQIKRLAYLALPNTRGALGSFDVDSLLPDTEGPDQQDAETALFWQSRDYIVKFRITGP